MTCDPLTQEVLGQPEHYRHTLWTRDVEDPDHWVLMYAGTAIRCHEHAKVHQGEAAWIECLVLPPDETPLTRP